MPAFTLEIVRSGETPAVVDVVTLYNVQASWPQVEALALLIDRPEDTFIRVKNDKGNTVIRAGVRTILASIHHCPCTQCPLKRVSAKRSAAKGASSRGLQSDLRLVDKTALYPCEIGAEPRDLLTIAQGP
ncbi:hypothetical protein [Methylocystis bryophila]|uniref:Uncharacterized protein n=1 Tax=Methylocystis bryophila TaxID=655015 RepID=A0A1W6MQK7_9HYPH|nr:hypothetical protein [Methylocystis bryophila]ARN79826.1 hypothetical protein B1812_00675 [Methylocystis bryophila]BDV39710.1 hypothetical protein DSM21852_29630 [Methylocystis bryophila]